MLEISVYVCMFTHVSTSSWMYSVAVAYTVPEWNNFHRNRTLNPVFLGIAAGFDLLNPSRHWQCHLFCALLRTNPIQHWLWCPFCVQLCTNCWWCLVSTCKSGEWSCVASATVAEQKLVALEMLRTAVSYLKWHSSVSDIRSTLCPCIPLWVNLLYCERCVCSGYKQFCCPAAAVGMLCAAKQNTCMYRVVLQVYIRIQLFWDVTLCPCVSGSSHCEGSQGSVLGLQ